MKTKYILISIAIIAAGLSFYFWPRKIGYIKIDANGASATLQLRRGLFIKTTITSDRQPAAVRAQLYYPARLHLIGKQAGDTWQIDSRGPWGQLANIRIKNNETTALRLGPPLLFKPNVTNRDSQVLIGFSIIGQAGEHYGNVITKNGWRVLTPELKIIDEAGNTLAAGKFEYG
jgi:hypothetical protein